MVICMTTQTSRPMRFGAKAVTAQEYHIQLLKEAKPASTEAKKLTLNDMVREPKNANGEVVVRPGKPWPQVTSRYIYKPDGSVVQEITYPSKNAKVQTSDPSVRAVLPAGSIPAELLT